MNYQNSIDETLETLQVKQSDGLTQQEVDRRLIQYGPNRLQGKKKRSVFSLFLSQLNDMLIFVLLAATVITLFIGEYIDAIIILTVILLNAGIGVFQEFKAEKALEALKKMTSPKAIVRRRSELKEVDSAMLVPGDIIILDTGRYVPADIRLIESVNLQIDESALTGESVPSDKLSNLSLTDGALPLGDQKNMAFMSTLVTYGRGEGVIISTGMNTEIGKIAKILDEDTQELTPLQRRLEELGKILGYIAIFICVSLFIIALIQGRDLFEMFLTSISLAVAAIPEGLPAIVAIVLALGVTRMSKINAIVKKLPAVETLGSVNIICSDKTGTLTQNKMTVVEAFTCSEHIKIDNTQDLSQFKKHQHLSKLAQVMVLCSDATFENGESTGDPTEVALVVFGNKLDINRKQLSFDRHRVAENPFDSDRKLMSVLTKEGQGYCVYTKGAIDNLINCCSSILINNQVVSLTKDYRDQITSAAEDMSNQALRVLGGAYKNVDQIIPPQDMENNLILVGIVGMIDPPRLEVKDSITTASKAGITAVMITGDHISTAFAIAKQLGIATAFNQCITGSQIDTFTDEEFSNHIKNIRVFARVSPEHKVKIVRAFKTNGNIVSMTGDGVNDAPSLKHADIGVAMGITGTDVSKGAADMILTDDNFTTIVYAIEEGRNIYNNIKKSVVFLLSCNLGEIIAVALSVLFYWPVPLLPTQILWINLITDSLPAIALGIEPGDKGVMIDKPRDPKESFFANGVAWRAIMGGTLIGAATLFAFYYGLGQKGFNLSSKNIPEASIAYARTMAFVVLAISQLFYSLSMRNFDKIVFRIGLTTNKFLIGSIVIGILLQFVVIAVPFLAQAFGVTMLLAYDWLIVLVLSLIPLIVNELFKIFKPSQVE